MSTLFRLSRRTKGADAQKKLSAVRLLKNFAQNCAELQPGFSLLTSRVLVLTAIVALADGWMFRSWLSRASFGRHTVSFTTALGADFGAPTDFGQGTLTTVVIDPDMWMSAIALGAGLVAAIMATALFSTDCLLRAAAFMHRRRVRRNLSRLLGTH